MVEPGEDRPGQVALDGVGAQRVAYLAHDHGGVERVTGDVADGHDQAGRRADGLVEVTADLGA